MYKKLVENLNLYCEALEQDALKVLNDPRYTPLAKDEYKIKLLDKRQNLLERIDAIKYELIKKVIQNNPLKELQTLTNDDKQRIIADYEFVKTVKGTSLNTEDVLKIWQPYFNYSLKSVIKMLPAEHRAIVEANYNEHIKPYLQANEDVDSIRNLNTGSLLTLQTTDYGATVRFNEPYIMKTISQKLYK